MRKGIGLHDLRDGAFEKTEVAGRSPAKPQRGVLDSPRQGLVAQSRLERRRHIAAPGKPVGRLIRSSGLKQTDALHPPATAALRAESADMLRRCPELNKSPDGIAFLTNRMMRDRTMSPEHRAIR